MEPDHKEMPKSRLDLDDVLTQAGQLGRYQLQVFATLALGVALAGCSSSEYIFTAAKINTRCLISECETFGDGLEFSPSWLANAVPTSGSTFDSCQQFAYAANTSAATMATTCACPQTLFTHTHTTVACDQYVYQTNNTIVYEFGLACEEWRRTLIGSLRAVGTMLGYPICGYISDRWGRRMALVVGATLTTVVGLLRCLATTYSAFVTAQVFETLLGGGAYSCAFVLLLEMVVSKWRMMGSSLCGTVFSLGQASCALLAWAVPHWRLLTLAVYLPQMLTISYIWLVPESTRWLISNGRLDDAVDGLRHIARVNGKLLPQTTLEGLRETVVHDTSQSKEKIQSKEQWLMLEVLRNKQLLFRCLVVPVWWVAFVFIYYGLSVNAVSISGNPYVNFMAVALVEIPGFWMSFLLVTTIGRKPPLIGGFLVCAACQLAYLFIPQESYSASLVVYLVGKSCIAMVAMGTYTYTAELFPTECRHRLLAYCSMVGRIGAVLAPLTPAFGGRLPFILFGAMALVAGLSAFLMPETRGKRLPDTLHDMMS